MVMPAVFGCDITELGRSVILFKLSLAYLPAPVVSPSKGLLPQLYPRTNRAYPI